MSPKKKKAKLSPGADSKKRTSEAPDSPRKRIKPILSKDEEIKVKKRKNFITACEQVSRRDYFDYRARLLLVYLPSCIETVCKHHDKDGINIKQMPSYAEEAFKTEMKNNIWYEALEVCHMCITPTQYLSSHVLQNVVEIMLNAHDEYSEHTANTIIDKCQLILMQNFSMHPPCLVKSLRNCYNTFLTSPMDLRDNTFTNRNQFEYRKGIVKYCMTRLEDELSAESIDGPLIDKDKNTPEEMKHTVKGLHWQKEKFEIYELLDREERIKRLFSVLETIIELLQFDLVIWHSRYSNDLGRHIMRSNKPLMAFILWSENVLYTGAVTNNCRQILRIFAQMVHLQYSDTMVKIITTWLNTMIQTFYICETNSNMDYPNTSRYCTVFARDFYKIISEMPHTSAIRIIEKIEPAFMRHLVGVLHLNTVLPTDESCIIRILINFINQAQWTSYPRDNNDIKLARKLFHPPKKVKNKVNYLLKTWLKTGSIEEDDVDYPKMEPKIEKIKVNISLNQIVHCLYITLDAYLDAYDLKSVREKWNDLNEQPNDTLIEHEIMPAHSCYIITESLIKKYRYTMQSMKELQGIFSDLKKCEKLPTIFDIFKNIHLLEL